MSRSALFHLDSAHARKARGALRRERAERSWASMMCWVAVVVFGFAGCATPAAAPAPSPALEEPPAAASSPDAVRYPELEGDWSGRIQVVYAGEEGPLADEVAEGGVIFDRLATRMTIAQQEGSLFYGYAHNSTGNDMLVGALRPDGRTALYATRRGGGVMYFDGSGTMSFCHTRSSEESLVAACATLSRRPMARDVSGDPGVDREG